MTKLEQSMIDFAREHNLTSFSIDCRPDAVSAEYVFGCYVHFEARPGMSACASGSGPTIGAALGWAIAEAAARRAYGDDIPLADVALPELAA